MSAFMLWRPRAASRQLANLGRTASSEWMSALGEPAPRPERRLLGHQPPNLAAGFEQLTTFNGRGVKARLRLSPPFASRKPAGRQSAPTPIEPHFHASRKRPFGSRLLTARRVQKTMAEPVVSQPTGCDTTASAAS